MKKLLFALLMFVPILSYGQTTYQSSQTNLYEWDGENYIMIESYKENITFVVNREYIEIIFNEMESMYTWWVKIPDQDPGFDCYITEGDKSKICLYFDLGSAMFYMTANENGRFTSAVELANIIKIE